MCYRLLKAMYGLKQAHLAWHTKLGGDLNGIGFMELKSAACIFRRKGKDGYDEYILAYVDDLLILARTIAAAVGKSIHPSDFHCASSSPHSP